MDAIDRLTDAFRKSEERAQVASDRQLNMTMTKLETITKNTTSETEQMMEFESTYSRKKTKTGKEKKLVDKNDFLP